jgi:hypothetical protein
MNARINPAPKMFVATMVLLATTLSASLSLASDQARVDPGLHPFAPVDGLTASELSPPDQPDFELEREDDNQLPRVMDRSIMLSQRIVGNVLRPTSSITGFTPIGGCAYATSNAQINWNTGLYLPQGALIRQVRMYFYDTSSDFNSLAWLLVHDLYGDLVSFHQVASSGNFGFSFNDTAIIDHSVDHTLYSYSLIWRPVITGDTMRLCGFRIFYEVAGPLIFQDRFEFG